MARRILTLTALVIGMLSAAGPAMACGGLLSPNGSVNLTRTTTLAAYYKGIEHYITAFSFVGGGGAKFGSIVPLPGVPTNVEPGGEWTLQRLVREVRPPVLEDAARGVAFTAAQSSARVILETTVEALDITVLEGGGGAVARWAQDNGFVLSPDAPEVLDFYANRSPIFMAARFNSDRAAAQGLSEGDGTPIHLTIPTPQPWVPLRILGLGKQPGEIVQADVFLLTDSEPAMLPAGRGVKAGELIPRTSGMVLGRSEWATKELLADLRSDRGMEWMPSDGMWLTFMEIDTTAAQLRYDLAIDSSGAGQPSYVAAGLSDALQRVRDIVSTEGTSWLAMLGLGAALGAVGGFVVRHRLSLGH
jgi:hypothetical protein